MTKQRTAEERVQELERRIEEIRARDERKRARANPATRAAIAAVKQLDRAIAAATDEPARRALQEARIAAGAVVAIDGVEIPVRNATPVKRARRPKPAAA